MHHISINIPAATYNELTNMIDIPTSDGQSFISISAAGLDHVSDIFYEAGSKQLESLLVKIDDQQ